jgi:hypothetical protein
VSRWRVLIPAGPELQEALRLAEMEFRDDP